MAKIIMLQIKNDLGEIVFDYGSIDKIVKDGYIRINSLG